MNDDRGSDRSIALQTLLTTLLPLIPGVQPYAGALIAIAPALRALFTRAGGNAEDFDALMANTREGIDLLANPDRFRHAPPNADLSPRRLPAPERVYDARIYERELASRPRAEYYRPGDVAWQFGDEDRFAVRQKGAGIGTPPPPWHETDFA